MHQQNPQAATSIAIRWLLGWCIPASASSIATMIARKCFYGGSDDDLGLEDSDDELLESDNQTMNHC